MIKLTRVTGETIVVNSDLILYVEETPDTMLTLRDGQHMLVKENADEVVRLALEYKRSAAAPWSQGGSG